ncbi:ribosome-associated translation inhibitor RaiA [Siccirubricoccus sp. KC 17139]|uniref:Ribosome hibernation promoting factor n=1 Tax=Siccirubricoccus soli TaxID=2899147 RepID=A0ABT1DC04_9PROT|nr:ribosome-associated translation inhibitor RaiA [Siccirubricoccus soli]MCO6418485.1 ribosome-associated translation inhibitor RaiA [Siccirubricoccus soli]MCP2684620.1 ribosome-associated translation inhibitor RaiA [Siccirubricoccus soli]
MHITVAGKQVETGEALQQRVREGLESIARKYFDHALEANVTFRRDAKGKLAAFFACDINLKAGRNLFMRGEGEGTDAHRAFEVAANHVAKRLRRYRRRVNEHARSFAEERDAAVAAVLRPDSEGEEAPDGVPDGVEDGALADGANGAHPPIVAERPTELAQMTVGEAAMQLDHTEQGVMMFRNSASGALNVVYRRPDGCVGWIDASAA